MCGIAGWVGPVSRRDEVLRMHESMRHRGPDGEGTWFSADGRAALAHRRLAILSPGPLAAQPMGAQGHTLVFNGEIYNHDALRKSLALDGIRFDIPGSDTEVLLRLCLAKGADAIPQLRGMFAFALYSESSRSLLLARDPFGIKPLYYAETHGGLVFASELRTILASGLIDRRLNPDAVAAFFQTGSVPEPSTLIEGIHLLPAGSHATWSASHGLKVEPYWQPEFPASEPGDPVLRAREALNESVERHLVSDVPVGIFLSGGIDSSVVAATAAGSRRLVAYSLVFDEPAFSEENRIQEVARQYGIELRELRLGPAEAKGLFGDYLAALDQPSVDGFNTFCVSRWAASHGAKVVLSGLGGDEIFGGYRSFHSMPGWHSWGRFLAAGGCLPKLAGSLLDSDGVAPRARRVGSWMQAPTDWSSAYSLVRGVFSHGESQALLRHFDLPPGRQASPALPPFGDPRDAVSYLELTRYMRNQLLRDSDVMSMANGLELRVPLVDSTFFESIASIPPDERFRPGKSLLTAAAPPILDAVRTASKQGFSLPLNEWWTAENWGDGGGFPPGVQPGTWARRMAVITFRDWSARNGIDLPSPQRTTRTLRRQQKTAPVLVLAPTFGNEPGGIQEFTREILHALATIDGPGRTPGVSYNGTRPPEHMLLDWADAAPSPLRSVRFACQTLHAALKWRPRAILSTFPRFAPVGVCCARMLGIPFITAAHGIEVWERLPFLKRLALQQSDLILAVSRFTALRISFANGITEGKTMVFPNTVDSSRFFPAPPSGSARSRLGIPDRALVALTVARLEAAEQSKGVETVWNALAARPELHEVFHVVAGDGNDLARLRLEAARRGISRRVIFHGTAAPDELPDLYRSADVFVMTGTTEGFGIVFLEAMACGKPVVAAAAGGTTDALLDGRLGWLVNPANASGTASAILAALTSLPTGEPRRDPGFLSASVEQSFGRDAFRRRLAEALERAVR